MGCRPMEKRNLLIVAVLLGLVPLCIFPTSAQQEATRLRVVVDLVQLNVAVTDNKGNYITDLQPADFAITEDGITEKIATFEEGDGPTRRLVEMPDEDKPDSSDNSLAQTEGQRGKVASS